MNSYVFNKLLPTDITHTVDNWLLQIIIIDRKNSGWRDIHNELKLKKTVGGAAAETLIKQNISSEIIEFLETYSL